MRRFIENFFSLVVLQGANYILPLITFPYLVRVLGIEKYGLVIYALAIAQYFVIFSTYGFNLYAPREIALADKNDPKINEIYSSVYVIKLIFTLLGFIVLYSLVKFIPALAENKEVFLFSYGIVLGQAMMPIWFFQGIEKMKLITLVDLISRLIYAISIFVFIRSDADFFKVPIFNSIGYIVAGLIGILLAKKYFAVQFYLPSFKVLLFHLKRSSSFFLSRVSVSFYTVSNTFVLGTFGSIELAGIYGIAEKLFNALQGIYHPLVNALYPFITKERNVKMFKKVFFIAIITNIVGLVVVFLFSDLLFQLLFKEVNVLALQTFNLLLIACLLIVPSALLGYPFLAALGHPKYTNYSVLVSSIIHLSVLTILVVTNSVSLFYIPYAILLTESIVLSIRIYGVKKYRLWQ
ncbi:MAG: oligosaccharide flippase family protein [Candidatus Delongbacteria bacterium]|nr:oligosaccharide flippase family protein [Candidatus Delongbacteria bacterium]